MSLLAGYLLRDKTSFLVILENRIHTQQVHSWSGAKAPAGWRYATNFLPARVITESKVGSDSEPFWNIRLLRIWKNRAFCGAVSDCRITPNFKKDSGLKFLFSQTVRKIKQSRHVGETLFHLCIAYFFKFMVANLSLTQLVTWDKPRYGVYRIAYFSFASANTRSIVSFRRSYKALYSGVCLMSSTVSR